jgi:serine/threonine-protein phosphatase 2B catalytic subunit
VHSSRKSDIENERLPPDLVDANSQEAKAMMSLPSTPAEEVAANGSNAFPLPLTISTSPLTLGGSAPGTPVLSPTSPTASPFRRGHVRQASLGTTMTSPSTRRRSIESTMSLIQDALDGKSKSIPEVSELAEKYSGTDGSGSGGSAR